MAKSPNPPYFAELISFSMNPPLQLSKCREGEEKKKKTTALRLPTDINRK